LPDHISTTLFLSYMMLVSRHEKHLPIQIGLQLLVNVACIFFSGVIAAFMAFMAFMAFIAFFAFIAFKALDLFVAVIACAIEQQRREQKKAGCA
jgi:energy-converting hydrogenase Eha subunit E